MPFQFVPEYVEKMATDALKYLPGCTLVNVVALGSYSAYEYTFAREGYDPVSKRFGYDFGLTSPEDQRGRVLAEQFEGLFVDTPKVEHVGFKVGATKHVVIHDKGYAPDDPLAPQPIKPDDEPAKEPDAPKSRRGNKGNK